MDYEEFIEKVVDGIMEYLPARFADYEVKRETMSKVNGDKDALVIRPPKQCSAVPMIYMDDMYQDYCEGTSLQDVLEAAAQEYMLGLKYAKRMGIGNVMSMPDDPSRIIAMLVNTKQNEKLLERVPHRDVMDLSVIYRHFIDLPDGTFNLANVDYKQMEDLGLSLEELDSLAMENTQRLLPVDVKHLDEQIFVLSNNRGLAGAGVLLDKDLLRKLANQCHCDLYLIPSSIHEIISVPVRDARAEFLQETLQKANSSVLAPKDVLSDHVYCYRRESRSLELALQTEEGGMYN